MQVSAATAALPAQTAAPASSAPKLEKPMQKLADLILADAVRGNQLDIHA